MGKSSLLTIHESTAIELKRVGDMTKLPVLSVYHSVVPLFLLGIEQEKTFIYPEGNFRAFLITPDNQTKAYLDDWSMDFLSDKDSNTLGFGFLFDKMYQTTIIRNYLLKNNFDRDHLKIMGYVSEKEFYRDCASMLDLIPQV